MNNIENDWYKETYERKERLLDWINCMINNEHEPHLCALAKWHVDYELKRLYEHLQK